VFVEEQDSNPVQPKLTWNGAAANCEISEPAKGKPIKTAKAIRVQAESVGEAIRGVRQCLPTLNTGTAYAKLKSELNETT